MFSPLRSFGEGSLHSITGFTFYSQLLFIHNYLKVAKVCFDLNPNLRRHQPHNNETVT